MASETLMTDPLASHVADKIRLIAVERGRDPLTLAAELLIAMNPDELKRWAERGFPTSEA